MQFHYYTMDKKNVMWLSQNLQARLQRDTAAGRADGGGRGCQQADVRQGEQQMSAIAADVSRPCAGVLLARLQDGPGGGHQHARGRQPPPRHLRPGVRPEGDRQDRPPLEERHYRGLVDKISRYLELLKLPLDQQDYISFQQHCSFQNFISTISICSDSR